MRIGVGIGIAIGIGVFIPAFDLDTDSDPDTDSDVWVASAIFGEETNWDERCIECYNNAIRTHMTDLDKGGGTMKGLVIDIGGFRLWEEEDGRGGSPQKKDSK